MAKRKLPAMPAKAEPEKDDRYAQAVRLVREWTPSRLRIAKQMAESGDLTQAVAVCEMLLADSAVVSALGARLDALFALTPTFEPSGDKRRSNRTVKALEVGEDWWAGLPESEQRQIVKWGLVLGAGLGRNRPTQRKEHGNRYLPMLEFWHPQGLRWNHAEQRWSIRDHKNVEHTVVPGDGTWVLHTPFGKSRPWANGLWYCLAHVVLLKAYAIVDVGRAGGRMSMLVAHAGKDVESTKEKRKQLAESLLDAIAEGGDAVAALPAGWMLDALKISEGLADLFETQVEYADQCIAICIRGGNLSTKVEGGSRAASESQAKQNEVPKLKFDAEAWSTTAHDQVLEPWAYWNYSDTALAPWPAYPTEPPEDAKALADTAKVAFEDLEIAERNGFTVDDRGFIERFKLGSFITGRKDEATRKKEAAERFAEQQKAMPAAPTAPGSQAPTPKPAKDDKAKQRAGGFVAQLASGDVAEGALAGQLYVDAVGDSATEAGIEALEITTAMIVAELEAATDYEDARDRLRALYRDKLVSDQTLNEILFSGMTLANLAGRAAVNQDV